MPEIEKGETVKYHMNDGHINALCGEKKARNITPRWSMVNCVRCLSNGLEHMTHKQRFKLGLARVERCRAGLAYSKAMSEVKKAEGRYRKAVDAMEEIEIKYRAMKPCASS